MWIEVERTRVEHTNCPTSEQDPREGKAVSFGQIDQGRCMNEVNMNTGKREDTRRRVQTGQVVG
jgi:hypothetical protein